jgi:hypothetical protein
MTCWRVAVAVLGSGRDLQDRHMYNCYAEQRGVTRQLLARCARLALVLDFFVAALQLYARILHIHSATSCYPHNKALSVATAATPGMYVSGVQMHSLPEAAVI